VNKKFSRKKENFICEVCDTRVVGDGYTDHCPNCLWGKHVDVFPGDRKSDCGGLMEPVGVEEKKGEWRILYRCQKCGYQHWNRTAPDDDFEKVIELGRRR